MPPSADVLKRNGVVMWGVCEAAQTILTQSPNQALTTTCGWTASLGVLSVKAPAKAIKMALRLTWTGRAVPNLEFPCDHVMDDLFPGLVPYRGTKAKGGVWYPSWAANMSYATAIEPNGLPFNPAGLEGMWIDWLVSANQQYLGNACPSDKQLPGIIWPGQDPARNGVVEGAWNTWAGQILWSCNTLIDPVGQGCKLLYNQDFCGESNDTECHELATSSKPTGTLLGFTENSEALQLQAGLQIPSFTEDMLREACSYDVIMIILDDAPLKGEPPKYTCDHVVALIDCDWEGDNYTVWTWGEKRYLNRSQILGQPVTFEEFAAKAPDKVDLAKKYARNPNNSIRGIFCSATVTNDITFAQLPSVASEQ